MKKSLSLLLAVIAAAGAVPLAAVSSPGNNSPDSQKSPASPAALLAFPHKPRELLVRFKDPLPSARLSQALSEAKAKPIREIPLVPDLYQVSIDPEANAEEVLGRLLKDEDVLYAEPNYLCRLTQTIPNDTRFDELWGMTKIEAPQAWSLATGAPEVVVAVIDTGVDYNHEDLKANMWTNTDGTHGYNAVANTRYPLDDHGHGTHAAGTIGAVGNNLKGVVGLSWKVKIMALKFLDAAGDGYTDDAITCIDFAVNKGARVLNNSWEVEQFSQAMFDAIKAADQAGILFVAAAGNSGKNIDVTSVYPASYNVPNVLAAASTTQYDSLSSFSNYGPTGVHVGAPGSDILSTVLTNGYETKSGTSMAAPHVSGLAALLMGYRPALDHLTIKQVIIDSVDYLDSLRDKVSSGGRVNAHQALLRSLNPTFTRTKWYFPAGGTRINNIDFDHYICVFNPGPEPVQANVSFLDENGLIGETASLVGAGSRNTIRVNDAIGDNRAHVSAIVTADQAILCERAMYWSPGGLRWRGGHNSIGLDQLSRKWHLAEGATHRFDPYIHLLNPDPDNAAAVEIVFFNHEGASWTTVTTVGPAANRTIEVAEAVGRDQVQLAASVSSDLPIAVERTMYWNDVGGDWVEGHSSTAAPEPASTWHFAEGATHLFNLYLLIANPSPTQTAQLLLTFRDVSGLLLSRDLTLGPQRRLTVKTNELVGSRGQVSIEVRSLNDVGVVAERTMLWEAGGISWEGGHNSLGARQAAEKWFLPEGATHFFDQYVLIYNPSASDQARVNCRFQNQTGLIANYELTVEPGARATVNARAVAGRQGQLSTTVESTNQVEIVVERAMYWNPEEIPWGGGHAALGIPVER